MTENEAIEYIERYTWSKTRLGLDRTRELLSRLGDPQDRLRFVHVAGSNGKGSTCAMLAAILQAAGYRVGLYTSPYLEQFRERMQINGRYIPPEDLARITERAAAAADTMEDHPSQFELVTAIGMVWFLEQGCDLVLLEVGMGGALDSTNVIGPPEAAVITNIGLEHTEYLGSTLAEIAAAKAGILKPGCRAVRYDMAPEAAEVIEAVCREKDIPLRRADFGQLESLSSGLEGQRFSYRGETCDLALLGRHQLYNAAVVLETVSVLRDRGWDIPPAAVRAGLAAVRWPARLEVLGRGPLFLLDGGHNPQCAEALANSLRELLPGRRFVFLMGVLGDKDWHAILASVLPLASEFICLTPLSDRALPGEELSAYLESRGVKARGMTSIPGGIGAALEAAGREGAVVCFGSLYLAGGVRGAYPDAARAYLRKAGIAARDRLAAPERAALSARIARNLTEAPAFRKAQTVMLYKAVGGEVSLDDAAAAALRAGKRLVYPRCGPAGTMEALSPPDPAAWQPGPFSIPEPDPARSQTVDPEEIDLVICPCAAFDGTGARLGMGGGYYDRFLPRCGNAAVLAAAFEVQRAEAIPRRDWDVPMDGIVTETGIILSGKKPPELFDIPAGRLYNEMVNTFRKE